MLRRSVVLTGRIVVVALIFLSAFSADVAARAATRVPRYPVLGVYVGSGQSAKVGQFTRLVRVRPTYVMEFTDSTSWATISDPSWQLERWKGTPYTMTWGVSMLPTSGATLATGATGAYDAYYRTLAANFVAAGAAGAVIRLGWEFNGTSFTWAAAGQSAAFVAYWQHVVTAMRAVPGARFTFVWDPNIGGDLPLAAYYPGNAFVDAIGMDVYDSEWQTYPGATAEFAKLTNEPNGLSWLASFASLHGKPIQIPEWGLGWGPSAPGSGPITVKGSEVSGGDNPTFVSLMSSWMTANHVTEATYWDYGTSAVSNTTNTKTLQALRTALVPIASGTPGVTRTSGGSGDGPLVLVAAAVVVAAVGAGLWSFRRSWRSPGRHSITAR
jgi:hypothetical protein